MKLPPWLFYNIIMLSGLGFKTGWCFSQKNCRVSIL